MENGKEKRGFELYVGGGLGAVPQQAKLFDEFLPEEELLPITQAIARVFARLGEKKNRAAARIKFLVTKLGIDEFRAARTGRAQNFAAGPAVGQLLAGCRKLQREPAETAGRTERPRTPGRVRSVVFQRMSIGKSSRDTRLPPSLCLLET